MSYIILLFYKYITIQKPEELQKEILQKAQEMSLMGRVIVSDEGINGTLEGLDSSTELFCSWLKSFADFSDIDIKKSVGNGNSFPKLSVKVRPEIVGTRLPKTKIDPRKKTAPHLPAEELKKWYTKNEDFVIVDMRNNYEFISGHFKNSINPELENSRDLPKAIEKLKEINTKKIVTVCTGGVRCEKMSAFLMDQGFDNVYQLENGIHSYMEKYPGEDFLGTLYTFDKRITMHFGGDREIIGECYLCKNKTEEYTNCVNKNCNKHFMVCTSCKEDKRGYFCSELCLSLIKKPDESLSNQKSS